MLLSKHTEIQAIEYNSILKGNFSPESHEYVEGVAAIHPDLADAMWTNLAEGGETNVYIPCAIPEEIKRNCTIVVRSR
jgi:hypothetical protein